MNDDIRITEIDPQLYEKRNEWIKYAFSYLELAHKIKAEMGISQKLFLRFFLTERTKENKKINKIDLKRDLHDRSPPSIYLFDKKSENKKGKIKEMNLQNELYAKESSGRGSRRWFFKTFHIPGIIASFTN